MSAEPTPRARAHWPELDQLRGLAAVLMILNHGGVQWLGERATGWEAALTFAGGLAPVFFFLVTGVGRGIQAAANPKKHANADVWRKVLLLFAADVVLWISPARLVGMDFLGFIALSTLVVEGVQRTRHPRLAAALGALLVLGVRFGVAPLLHLPEPDSPAQAVGRFLLGDRSLAGFSYPPCPWLAFPLVGYLLGYFAQAHAERIRQRRWPVSLGLSICGALGLLLCLFFRQRGMVFFRWGTLSLAYTAFAFSTLACGVALVLAIASTSAGRLLSLPGTSSLAVVPIHYFIIHMAHRAWPAIGEDGRYPFAIFVAITLSLALSLAIDRAVSAAARERRDSASYWFGLATITLVFTAATAFAQDSARDVSTVIAQLAVCALFPLPWPRVTSTKTS